MDKTLTTFELVDPLRVYPDWRDAELVRVRVAIEGRGDAAELRQVLLETVKTLRLIAFEEFEYAMRPCPRCSPRVVMPATRDLAERLAAYLDTLPPLT